MAKMQSVLPGDFKNLGLASYEVTMLADAYQAVTKVEGGWEYLARPDVPKGGSFMFGPETPILNAINNAMTFQGHSGATYGMTMRQIEFIAKHGWDAYVKQVAPHLAVPVSQPLSPAREFLSNLQKTPNVLPNQDEQVKVFETFLDGKMSYAEMRERIG